MDSLEKALQLIKEWEYDEAYRMLLRLANRGDAKAMLELGIMYVRGRGVCKNEVTALEWFKKAAELGNSSAQFNIGLSYNEGLGVPRNLETAIYWYSKAADNGNEDAHVNLAHLYAGNYGVKLDIEKAIHHICAFDKGREGMLASRHLSALKLAIERKLPSKNILYKYASDAKQAAEGHLLGKPSRTTIFSEMRDIVYFNIHHSISGDILGQYFRIDESTVEEARLIHCFEVRNENEVYGRFGFLLDDLRFPNWKI